MARFISLLRFTDQGARNIHQSATRADAFSREAAQRGVKVEMQVWTTGRYDGVLVLDGDPKAVLSALADLTALGNVRTETLQTFSADDLKPAR